MPQYGGQPFGYRFDSKTLEMLPMFCGGQWIEILIDVKSGVSYATFFTNLK